MFFTPKKVVSLLLVAMFFLAPVSSYAQTTYYQPSTKQEYIAYLLGILAQLQAQLAAQQQLEANTNTGKTTVVRKSPNPYFVIVTTLASVSIGRTVVTLRGEVDKGSSETLDVWVAYGTGGNLSLFKNAPTVTKSSRQTVDVTLDDLRPGTTYNYRFVTEDMRGYRHYGEVRSFTTIDVAETQSFYGKPTAETEGASSIDSTSAKVSGFVSMNDYLSGNAFVVYGQDRGAVEDADYFASYNDIAVVAGSINKRSASSKFTGRNTVVVGLSGLSRATKYYYRTCIEFSRNNDGINPAIRCGEVESFVTLN